jgi:hypothetical protein
MRAPSAAKRVADAGALGGEARRRGGADARGGAGDQCNPFLQASHVVLQGAVHESFEIDRVFSRGA